MPSVAVSTGLFILAASLFSAFSIAWALLRLEARRAAPKRLPLSADHSQTAFLFDGKVLADASPSALRFVGAPVNRNAVWLKLQARLELFAPGVADAMSALARDGLGFSSEINSDDTAFVMKGAMDGGLIRITFTDAKDAASDPKLPEAKTPKADDAFFHDLENYDPVPVWRIGASGQILWANARYRHLSGAVGEASPTTVFPEDVLWGRPVQLTKGPEKGSWFEISAADLPNGDRLCFAMPISNTVKAEEALKRFVQTLTKTFAHIPIGIAIFDRDRRLVMFNPALSEMTKLPPEWLSGRPQLNALLDRLRDNHHLPEPKDYKSWKFRMEALVRAAESGTYQENWSLPSGETYRVSGRPHPEGAVAFLFEDITPTISMQRQVRSELELGQSVVNTLPEAMAAFSSDGELILANDAFEDIWGFDPREMLSRLYLGSALDLWKSDCASTKPLAAFANAIQTHKPWQGTLCHSEKGSIETRLTPLSRGGLLVSFTCPALANKGRPDLSVVEETT